MIPYVLNRGLTIFVRKCMKYWYYQYRLHSLAHYYYSPPPSLRSSAPRLALSCSAAALCCDIPLVQHCPFWKTRSRFDFYACCCATPLATFRFSPSHSTCQRCILRVVAYSRPGDADADAESDADAKRAVKIQSALELNGISILMTKAFSKE